MIVDQMENRSGVRTRMLSTANTGIARPTLLMLIARVPPLPMWPSQRPIGMAIRQARNTDATVSHSCSANRAAMPSGPGQFAGSRSHRMPSMKAFISRVRPSPRNHQALGTDEEQVYNDREHHAQDRAGQDLWLEVAVLSLVR